MTAPGAEGIIPLVSNSPLISWHFKLFGPFLFKDIISLGVSLYLIRHFGKKAIAMENTLNTDVRHDIQSQVQGTGMCVSRLSALTSLIS
jgi:hypothetical protein